ncbi:MAG: hypothetical protein WBG86_14485 [Polyangiales bacterium]
MKTRIGNASEFVEGRPTRTYRSHRKRPVKLSGYVYCDLQGEVHADTLDPYDYGPPEGTGQDSRCKPEDHRPVWIWAAPVEGKF